MDVRNEPELVRELLRKNKLKKHVDDKEQTGLSLVLQLKEKYGMTEEEAREQAISSVLAPPNGRAILDDDPPEPIPAKERKMIYRRLEVWGRAEERQEKRDFKKDHHGLI
jgi:hypothetical protein